MRGKERNKTVSKKKSIETREEGWKQLVGEIVGLTSYIAGTASTRAFLCAYAVALLLSPFALFAVAQFAGYMAISTETTFAGLV